MIKSQGVCDTTLTERFEYLLCNCGTYPFNLGPCLTWTPNNENRCVYCDHGLECHQAISQLL
jgi:hypothetical protein